MFKKVTWLLLFLVFLFPTLTFAIDFDLPFFSAPLMSKPKDFTRIHEDSGYNSQNVKILNIETDYSDSLNSLGGGDIDILDGMALSGDFAGSDFSIKMNKPVSSGKISLYEVREGDTLSQIAGMFNVSVNTIKWANDFTGPIQPGQQLVILPVTGLTHTVKNGGTIADVAEIYDADIKEIALFNGISEDHELQPGDEVIVPNVDPVIKEKPAKNYPSPSHVVSSPSPASAGYYRNPIPGAIVTQGIHGYNAMDLGAPYGTPIHAAAAGRVISSKGGGWNGGYGNMIIISHPNGTQTLYSHQSSNIVSVGQVVSAGEVIGYVGSTGNSTGNHLHFEVRGGVNPITRCRVGSVCR